MIISQTRLAMMVFGAVSNNNKDDNLESFIKDFRNLKEFEISVREGKYSPATTHSHLKLLVQKEILFKVSKGCRFKGASVYAWNEDFLRCCDDVEYLLARLKDILCSK